MSIDTNLLKQIVEGALMAAGRPLPVPAILDLFELDGRPEAADVRAVLEEIAQDCENRGYELKQVSSGYRFQVKQQFGEWVGRLWEEKPQRYSRALLETLSLIAYRQPITRGDIEEIRGVAVSTNIIRTLQEREWVKVVGHRDVPGKPELFATTRQFLDYFNLRSLTELPSLAEIKDFEAIDPVLELPIEQEASAEPGVESTEAAEIESEEMAGTEDEDDNEPATLPN